MNSYEYFVVLSSKISAAEQEGFLDKFEKVMEKNKVKKITRDDWGKRTLAYPIKGETEARYILYNLKSPPDAVEELERNCRLDERVIRFLTVRLDVVKAERVKARLAAKKSASKNGGKDRTKASGDDGGRNRTGAPVEMQSENEGGKDG